MMRSLGLLVAFEMGKAAVGGAVGVAHDQDALGLVQEDGHANLLQDEVPLKVVARGGEGFGSSGDDDHVGAFDPLLLQKFSHGRADAVVEAAEDGSVGYVGGGGRVEMEDLAHRSSCLDSNFRNQVCHYLSPVSSGSASSSSSASSRSHASTRCSRPGKKVASTRIKAFPTET